MPCARIVRDQPGRVAGCDASGVSLLPPQPQLVATRSSDARARRSPRGFQRAGVRVDPEVGEQLREALDHDRELEPGEVRAQAEVAAVAERDVAVRVPVEDAPLGLVEGARVVVRRAVGEQDDVAGRDRLAVELDVMRARCGRRPAPARRSAAAR